MTEQQAIEQQKVLRKQVIKEDQLPAEVKTVAGVDVAYEKEGDRLIAAIAVLYVHDLSMKELVVVEDNISFPYIPGLFSFREMPPVLKALDQLAEKPDLIVCDGQGFAHPRRFGLACHLGVVSGIPTIGCGKSRLTGIFVEPESARGSFSALMDDGEEIGRVLRTQNGRKPVFVSIGHKVSLATASDWVLKLCPSYRLPETTRAADQAVNKVLKGG